MKPLHLPALALVGASALPLAGWGSRSACATHPTQIGQLDEMAGDPAASRSPERLATGELTAFGPVIRRHDPAGGRKFAAPCPNSTRSSC